MRPELGISFSVSIGNEPYGSFTTLTSRPLACSRTMTNFNLDYDLVWDDAHVKTHTEIPSYVLSFPFPSHLGSMM
jgi:hypothetical protein